MHISSNEVRFQNQLAIGVLAHKLYIHTQTLKFYQYVTNPTLIFQQYKWKNNTSKLNISMLSLHILYK